MQAEQIEAFEFKGFRLVHNDKVMKAGIDSILLGAWLNVEGAQRILDIGTGSGLLALMLAQRSSAKEIHGIDVSEDAFTLSSINFSKSDWKSELESHHITIQEFVEKDCGKFDVVVCNPPFFTGGIFSENEQRAVMRHTVKLSHRDLLRCSSDILEKGGRFNVVLPFIEGLRFIEMASMYGLHVQRKCKVYPKPEKSCNRLLLEFGREEKEEVVEEVVVREEDDSFTSSFIKLTSLFYKNL